MKLIRYVVNPGVFLYISFVVATVYPLPYLLVDGYHNHQRVVQVFLLLLNACFYISLAKRANYFYSADERLITITTTTFFIGGALSLFHSEIFFHSLLDYLQWIFLLLLSVTCANWSAANRKVEVFIGIFLLVQALGVFIATMYLIFAIVLGDALSADMIYPGVENIRTYNQIQVFVIPLLIFLLPTKRFSLIALTVLFANFLLLFIGGARGSTAVLVFLFALAWNFSWLRRRINKAAFAFFGACIIYGVLFLILPDGMRDLSRSGSSGRVDMWLEIICSFGWHNLLWGVGPNGYVLFTNTFISGHPHNSVLQISLEWGGLALFAIVVLICRILYRAYQHIRQNPSDELTQALCASWLAALAYSLFDGVIVMPIAQTLIFIFGGLIWGRVRNNSFAREQNIKSKSWQSTLVGVAVLVICGSYTWLASVYYVQQAGDPSEIRGPRFWVNGAPLKYSTEQLKLDIEYLMK